MDQLSAQTLWNGAATGEIISGGNESICTRDYKSSGAGVPYKRVGGDHGGAWGSRGGSRSRTPTRKLTSGLARREKERGVVVVVVVAASICKAIGVVLSNATGR